MINQQYRTRGLASLRQRSGTSPLDIMYQSFLQVGSLTANSQGINTLRAVPLTIAAGGEIDKIYFEITVGGTAGSKGRVGIYGATSETNIYPNDLIVDSGEFDTTIIGIKTTTISPAISIQPNRLYWMVSLYGTAAPSARLINNVSTSHVLGFPATPGTGPRSGITVAQTYGALPSTFPASGTFTNTNLTSVGIHFA